MHLLRKRTHSLRASPEFALAVLITLGLAGLYGLMVGLMALRLDFLLPGKFAQMAHFTLAHHRTHDLTFGFLFVPAVVGMLAQLRRPLKNVSAQLMALIPSLGLLLTLMLGFFLTNNTNVLQPPWVTVGVAALIATVLHPAGRDLLRSFSVARINRVMLTLVIIAAVPLLVFASTNIRLQGTVTDDHAGMGHYGFMAAFAFAVIGVALLASLRPEGWRLTAWTAGLLSALLGLASLGFPNATSSLGLAWALTAIAWGAGFVAAAELAVKSDPTPYPDTGDDTGDDTGVGPGPGTLHGTPRWVKVSGMIALVLLLLVVTAMLTGGGLGGHTLPSGGHRRP